MEHTYTCAGVELVYTIDTTEIDRFDPMSGHYTEPGEPFVEMVTHKGVDITHMLNDETLAEILEDYLSE